MSGRLTVRPDRGSHTMRWAASIVTVALLSACATTSQPGPVSTTGTAPTRSYPNWPTLVDDFRFQWSAEPGIDLTEGPAVVVRAYVESYNIAIFTADSNNVYPGFMRATPANQTYREATALQLTGIRPLGEGYTVTPRDARPHFGSMQFHLLEITPAADGLEVLACIGDYANFIESDIEPGKFVSVAAIQSNAAPRPDTGVRPLRITMTQHDPRVGPNAPAPVSAPQEGPAPAPDQDVFGNWFITGASFGGWGPKDAPEPTRWPPASLKQRCSQAMPQNEAERLSIITGFKDKPPPHGDAAPGWPLDAA